jgi:hypothetical protein
MGVSRQDSSAHSAQPVHVSCAARVCVLREALCTRVCAAPARPPTCWLQACVSSATSCGSACTGDDTV